MAITAQDIHNQSFAIGRKGYDIDEVDVFLEHVADEIDLLNDQIAHLKSELAQAKEQAEAAKAEAVQEVVVAAPEVVEEDVSFDATDANREDLLSAIQEKDAKILSLQSQLAEKQANDSAISQALIIAQRSADEIIVKANAQASETMQDAREEADRIINRANADKQSVLDAIRKLEDDRESARTGYADLLRDFIDDASRKLGELGYDDDIDNIPGIGRDGGQLDVVYEETVANYMPAEAISQAEPINPALEKDLSGFGDVEANFGDVD